MTIEKLKENNTDYLIKYITKGYDFPLHRKFSATIGLNRSRIKTTIYKNTRESDALLWYAESRGFRIKHQNRRNTALEYTITRGAAAPCVDLFNTDTKDENLEEVFYKLLNYYERNKRMIQKTHKEASKYAREYRERKEKAEATANRE